METIDPFKNHLKVDEWWNEMRNRYLGVDRNDIIFNSSQGMSLEREDDVVKLILDRPTKLCIGH